MPGKTVSSQLIAWDSGEVTFESSGGAAGSNSTKPHFDDVKQLL
jgi:hypothetical protein